MFFFNASAPTGIYTLSLHDALPISFHKFLPVCQIGFRSFQMQKIAYQFVQALRSEEHTSELQSLTNLVCRLLLEKKKFDRQVGPRTRIVAMTPGILLPMLLDDPYLQ